MSTALTKVSYEPLAAFALGILCNGLVCLAVWLTYSARTTTDRILAIVPPIAAFVAMGFEHSVANMYFIPVAMLIRAVAPPAFWAGIGHVPADYAAVDCRRLPGQPRAGDPGEHRRRDAPRGRGLLAGLPAPPR